MRFTSYKAVARNRRQSRDRKWYVILKANESEDYFLRLTVDGVNIYTESEAGVEVTEKVTEKVSCLSEMIQYLLTVPHAIVHTATTASLFCLSPTYNRGRVGIRVVGITSFPSCLFRE